MNPREIYWHLGILFNFAINWLVVASFTKEVNLRLAKRPLVFNGRLANRWLTSLVKEATVVFSFVQHICNKNNVL